LNVEEWKQGPPAADAPPAVLLPALQRRSKMSRSRFSEKVMLGERMERDDDQVFQLRRGAR
jgi:hypothetical protein